MNLVLREHMCLRHLVRRTSDPTLVSDEYPIEAGSEEISRSGSGSNQFYPKLRDLQAQRATQRRQDGSMAYGSRIAESMHLTW